MQWSGLAYPAFAALLLAQQPQNHLAEEVSRQMGRGEGKLKLGDGAVDFELAYAGGKSGRVQLSKFFGKRPVALVFGSFT
ncbi:MAG: hypothetical protein J0L64_15300 [Acidobacteria bacterium]|nr:hypothetical protein [Acidobacteriota bacterium]